MFEGDTVWLTQKQMADLFDKGRITITEHIQNIFKEGELNEKTVCREFRRTGGDGKEYLVKYYNLDVIISVGYRVKSLRGTQFRIWATRTLKEHLLQGYTFNQKRLTKTGLTALEKALQFIKKSSSKRELTNQEAQGLLEVITGYAKSWLLLKQYDKHSLPTPKGVSPIFTFAYDKVLDVIAQLRER